MLHEKIKFAIFVVNLHIMILIVGVAVVSLDNAYYNKTKCKLCNYYLML